MKPEIKKGTPDPKEKINQQYIADQLGISRTTVSRCFTNHAGINPVTRAKVFDVASKLGYQHMETRTPSTRKSTAMTRVGVLVCTELEEYFRPDYESPGVKLFAGVSELAQLRNVKIDLRDVDPKEDSLASASYREIVPLQKREWDGVILIYPFPRNIVDDIHRTFPTVSLVEQDGTASFNCVDVDHYKGIATLINQLVALGHERIGFYTKRYEVEAEWSLRRYSAYVEKMTRRGATLNDEDIVNVNPKSYISLEESFNHVAKRIEKGVTAWLCAADHQAYDLIAALNKRGIRTPRDVSITGFDGIEKPDWAPLLTTTVIPYWEIGYTGGRRLLEIMRKRSGSAQHILISSQIREGETIGPVKKG